MIEYSEGFINKMIKSVLNLEKSKVIMWQLKWPVLSDVRTVFKQSKEEDEVLIKFYGKYLNEGLTTMQKAEILARQVNNRLIYKEDINVWGKLEYWATPIETHEKVTDDCFSGDTLVLKSDGTLISIDNLQVNDRIISVNGLPTTVIYKSYKGKKMTINYDLNIGGTIDVTRDHTFSISTSKFKKTNQIWIDKKAIEIQKGEQLETINKLTFENEIDIGYELGYLFGLYLADGWTREKYEKNNSTIYIAGKDGHKKQKQKEWLRDYCKKRGIPFFMRRRYCYFKSNKLFNQIREYFGESGAKNKTIRRLAFDIEGTKGLLDGLKADANERIKDLTYSTINKSIALAIRIWLRRIGLQCSIRKVEKHGGFGKNPIYRIGVKRKKPCRVLIKSINNGTLKDTYNITTESGKVYLPSQDCVIRQCDGYSNLIVYLLRLFGAAPFEVFTRTGIVIDKKGNEVLHAHPIILNTENMKFYPLEGSFYAKEALDNFGKVPIQDNSTYNKETYFVTNDLISFADYPIIRLVR